MVHLEILCREAPSPSVSIIQRRQGSDPGVRRTRPRAVFIFSRIQCVSLLNGDRLPGEQHKCSASVCRPKWRHDARSGVAFQLALLREAVGRGQFLTCKPISRQHTCVHLSSFSDLLSKAVLKAEKGKGY